MRGGKYLIITYDNSVTFFRYDTSLLLHQYIVQVGAFLVLFVQIDRSVVRGEGGKVSYGRLDFAYIIMVRVEVSSCNDLTCRS